MTTLTPEAPPQTTTNEAPATATETVLNRGLRKPVDGELALPVWGRATTAAVGLRCRSATLRHRYDEAPRLLAGDAEPTPLDLTAKTRAAEVAA